MGSNRSRRPPQWSVGPHRVLLLRHGRIGDMVLATGIIHEIALAQPSVTIDVLAAPGNAAVLEGNPHVRQVISVKTKHPLSLLAAGWRIRRTHYDAVLDPMFPKASFTNMLLMGLSGAPHRIGIAGRGIDYALTMPVAPLEAAVHHVDHTAALLAAFGVDLQGISRLVAGAAPLPALAGVRACRPATGWGVFNSRIYLSDSEQQLGEAAWHAPPGAAVRLLVNVSVSSVERQWGEDSFIAALNHVKRRFPQVVALIVGSPQDGPRMERIARASGAQVAHTPHYRQMMAIVAASDLVLTGDTSVTHVACAFGKPVLALFPGHGGAAFGPYAGGYIISTPAQTLGPLEVEPVTEGLDALLIPRVKTQAPPRS